MAVSMVRIMYYVRTYTQVTSFAKLEISPLDSVSLKEIMHNHGVNMRYLGRIAALCDKVKLVHIRVCVCVCV